MRRPLLITFIIGLFALAGCTGDAGPEGPVGPQGPPGSPRIKVLFWTTSTIADMREMIVIAYDRKLFPTGTIIDDRRMQDPLPTVDELKEYDAILAYTSQTLTNRAEIGDLLADYVDAGGGVVLGQGAFSTGTGLGPIEGRIMTDGYSPLRPGPSSNNIHNRKIDFTSLQFPLHPIFNGTDVLNLCFLSQPSYSNPGYDLTATIIALDTECTTQAQPTAFTSVAISANERVIGLNIYPGWNIYEDTFPQPIQLIVNWRNVAVPETASIKMTSHA